MFWGEIKQTKMRKWLLHAYGSDDLGLEDTLILEMFRFPVSLLDTDSDT